MDIQNLINDIASRLTGTNALIQIQVGNKYYTKRVGDINLLADNPEHLTVKDNRSFPRWMQEQIHRCKLSKGTIGNHQNTLDVLRGFRYDFTFSDITYEFIMEFDHYIKSLGYAVNTLAKFMKIFQAVYQSGHRQRHHYGQSIPQVSYPSGADKKEYRN